MSIKRQQKDMAGSVSVVDGDTLIMNFSDSPIPRMEKLYGKDYVALGDAKNDFPDHLLYLYNKSALHNAIIVGKCMYIMGSGLDTDSMANESQTWGNLLEILNVDIEVFGGCYIERIPKVNGKGYNSYHISYDRLRTNEDNSRFFYKKDWQQPYKWRDCDRDYEAYYDGIAEPSIFFYKEYRAGKKPYPLPCYVGAMNDIESSIETSKHTLTNAKTGFSAGKLITFYMGDDATAKKAIDRKITNAYGGAEGRKFMLAFATDSTMKPTVEDLGQSDLSKENITPIQSIITQNILSGHGVTHGLLFGIQQEGKLGGATELRTAYNIFNKNYIQRKQKALENIVFALGGFEAKIIPSEPVDLELNLTDFKDIIPKEFILEKLGIDPTKYNVQPTAPTGDIQQASTNSTLTKLSGREFQGMMRIVRQYNQGKVNKDQAAILLKNGYGFTDDDVNSYLGVDADPLTQDAKFSDQYNEVDVAMMFDEAGENEESYSTVLSQEYNEDEAAEFKLQFAAVESLTELEKQVSDILKKDPKVTNDAIAKALNVTKEAVDTITTKLINDGVIAAETIGDTITRKVIETTAKSSLPDISIMYKYAKRDGVGGTDLLPTSRPFCVRMLTQNKGKLYSRSDIQKISERVGYSVFNRAGGFWNNNGTVDAQCRHGWFRVIVMKKSGK
jgi:DNA-binding MarR family transcriptional regulator